MVVLEELLTRLKEWFHQLQKDAPMDLWLQALVLLVFCVGFNATSWLLTPKKGTTAPPPPAELPERCVQVKETPSVAKAPRQESRREDVRSVLLSVELSAQSGISTLDPGKDAMPIAGRENRLSTSGSLETTEVWKKAVRYDPYAGEGEAPVEAMGGGEINSSARGLFRLAQLTGHSSTIAPGACKRCGSVGHLFYQCRNMFTLQKELSFCDVYDLEEKKLDQFVEEEDDDDEDDAASEELPTSDESDDSDSDDSDEDDSSSSSEKKKKKKMLSYQICSSWWLPYMGVGEKQKAKEVSASIRCAWPRPGAKVGTVEPESPASLEVRPIFTFDGLDFDGDRIVNLREKPYYFDQHLGGAMSISFIARWDAFALRSRIIDFGDGPTADNIIIANLETGRSLIVEVFRGPSKKRLTMPGSLAIGETHRYLLSISETGLMRMLQDGSQLGVQPQGYAPRTLERRKLLVGGSNWSSDENFQGEISELKIWPREVSWKEAFPVETPLPPPRLPPKEEPEEQKPEKQVEDEEVQTEPLPELAQESQAPDEDEEGWTAVSKPRTKAEKRAKAEARKPVQVPSPPPPPRRNSGASSTTSATPSVPPPPPEPTKRKGRAKGEGKSFPTVAVSSAPVAAPVMPPTPPAPPVHEEAEKTKETKESKEVDTVEVTETKESKQELAEKKRGKAWADIPPEGTPPNSPPNTGLVLTEVQTPQQEILESPVQNGAGGQADTEDSGFEVLTGKRRPKVAPEVVLGPGDRPKVQESSPPPIDTSGTTSPSKGQQTTTPSTLSPLEKEILRLEKKQREVEKLKQRQADGEELDHLQRKKLLCEDEMTQKLSELHLKKALLKAPQVTHHSEGDGGSPEPWDLPKVPVAPAMGQPSTGSVTRTPLRAPSREGSFRPGVGGGFFWRVEVLENQFLDSQVLNYTPKV
eukprot:symbB.v1.2.004922.t1/scaffold281.1/size241006/3